MESTSNSRVMFLSFGIIHVLDQTIFLLLGLSCEKKVDLQHFWPTRDQYHLVSCDNQKCPLHCQMSTGWQICIIHLLCH